MLQNEKRDVSFSEMNLFDCMYAHDIYKPKVNIKTGISDCEKGGPPDKVFIESFIVGVTATADGQEYVKLPDKNKDYPVRFYV